MAGYGSCQPLNFYRFYPDRFYQTMRALKNFRYVISTPSLVIPNEVRNLVILKKPIAISGSDSDDAKHY